MSFGIILLVKACWPPNLNFVAISATSTVDETILSTKLYVTTSPIPSVMNWLCMLDIAPVLIAISAWTVLKADVVSCIISHEFTVAIWSICVVVTSVAYGDSIQSIIWFLVVQ